MGSLAYEVSGKNTSMEIIKNLGASDESHFRTATIFLAVLLVPIGVFSNAVILLSYSATKQSSKRTKHLFLASLAFTDTLTIFLMICYSIYVVAPSARSPKAYLILSSLHIFLCANSQLHNIAISVERTIAIKYPLRHRTIFTSSQRKLTVILVWLFSFALFILSALRGAILAQVYKDFVFWLLIAACFVSPLVVTFVGYSVILLTAIRTHEKSTLTKHACQVNRQRWKELRIFLGVSLMVLPILTCWSIFFICTIYEAVEQKKFSGLMDWILTFLPFIGACLNPVLYVVGTRSIREKAVVVSQMISNVSHYLRTVSLISRKPSVL